MSTPIDGIVLQDTQTGKIEEYEFQDAWARQQLPTKASQASVDTISGQIATLVANKGDTSTNAELLDIRTGVSKTYATAGEAVREIAKGGGLNRGAVKFDKIDPAVTKFTKLVKSPNMINAESALIPEIVSSTKGTFAASTDYVRTDYLEVEPSTTYTFLHKINTTAVGNTYYAVYDEKKVFISGSSLSGKTFTTPANAKYLVISFKMPSGISHQKWVYLGPVNQPFSLYGVYQALNGYSGDKAAPVSSFNLINYKTIHDSYIVDVGDPLTGLTFSEILLSRNPFESYWITDLIPVTTGQTYSFWEVLDKVTPVVKNVRQIVEYDENERYIGQFLNTTSYTPSSNFVKYVTIGYSKSTSVPENQMMIKGLTAPSKYMPYRESIVLNGVPLLDKTSLDWYGKKICTYGDGLTKDGRWQKQVIDYFGFTNHYMRGVTGSKITDLTPGTIMVDDNGNQVESGGTEILDSMCEEDRINTIPQDSDLVLITCGNDDFLNGTDIGETTDNVSTFKGALAATIYNIMVRTQYKAPIALVTPLNIYCDDSKQPIENNANLTMKDYVVAIREVAEEFSIPCIDLFTQSGISPWTKNLYMQSPDRINPTYNIENSGADQIARVVIGQLKTILPKPKDVFYQK